MNGPPQFPCPALPEDPPQARLLGVYPQRQEGQWMQRVRLLGGRLSAGQWRTLAQAARRFTPNEPLHLTTRQDVEFHSLAGPDIPALQAMLHQAGLSTLGAGGDSLRNVTVCPGGGRCPGSIDLIEPAGRVARALEEMDGIFHLPRKFKISFSCCPRACAMPWINDLGFVVAPRPGTLAGEGAAFGLEVIGAGSMGPRPATGMRLAEWIAPGQLIPCAAAAVTVFAARGDRRNRGAARLRHVRQRLGDQEFLRLFQQEFVRQSARSGNGPSDNEPPNSRRVGLPPPPAGRPARVLLSFPDGDLPPAAAEAIADLMDRHEAVPRIDLGHGVIVFGRDPPSLRSAVEQVAALRVAAVEQARVVACPGRRWCRRGLVDTRAVASAVRGQLRSDGPVVRISGCPNGCAQHAVAEVGLVGRIVSADGQRREAFDVLAGGGEGRNDRLARPLAQAVPAGEVPALLRRHGKHPLSLSE